jgi:homoserine kinase
MKRIRVTVPATTANFGSGFDCLGSALKLYNIVECELHDRTINSVFNIDIEGEGEATLPRDKSNIIVQTMEYIFNKLKYKHLYKKMRIKLINNIPIARGLGSSASIRIAGIIIANILCNNKLTDNEIISIATKLEGHPDNVVPAMFGGLCLSYHKLQYRNKKESDIGFFKLEMPDDIVALFCIPEFELKTTDARKILPKKIDMGSAVFNSSRVGLFIYSILQKKYDLLKIAMEDRIHQEYRMKLIPGMKEIFNSINFSDILGIALSGSGPTIMALCKKDEVDYDKIGRNIQEIFSKYNIRSKYNVINFDNKGAKIHIEKK